MRGYITNAILELKRILRDQYDHHSIIKELLQNADDAKAGQFHLGWIDDFPLDVHPLLCSPTILVLNDGEFTIKHWDAIGRLDIGSKGGDAASIGKFGLGMKSVFNHCEAFFYLLSDSQPAAMDPKGSKTDLINPWASPGLEFAFHQEWQDIENAGRYLRSQIQKWPHNCSQWFCLAIPLRTKPQLDGTPPLKERYSTVTDFFKPNLSEEISQMMPLLRHIETVTIWKWNRESMGLQKDATIRVCQEESVRSAFPHLVKNEESVICGSVEVISSSQSDKKRLQFGGMEKLLETPEFSNLSRDGHWPKALVMDENGQDKFKAEAAEPHCSAIFTLMPNDGGKAHGNIAVHDAVFLPLLETESREACSIGYDINLSLHGYFFLDAGRKSLVSSKAGESSVEFRWNQCLKQDGLYPLILPSLAVFFEKAELGPEKTSRIVEKLNHIIRQREILKELKMQWIWCIFPDSHERGRWGILSQDTPYFEIPKPTGSDLSVPFTVFQELGRLSSTHVITYQGHSRITPREPEMWSDHKQLLDSLFRSTTEDLFSKVDYVDFLVRFISKNISKNACPPETTTLLIHKIGASISRAGLESIQRVQSRLNRLLEFLPKNAVVTYKPVQQEEGRVFSELLSLNLTCLFLPASLVRMNAAQESHLTIQDGIKICKWLSMDKKLDPRNTFLLACRVIQKIAGAISIKRQHLGDYPLFPAKSYAGDGETIMSWNELDTLQRQHRLFAGGSPFVGPLQRAVKLEGFFRLTESGNVNAFEILFELSKAPNCDKMDCFSILKGSPPVGLPEDRRELFAKLLIQPAQLPPGDYIRTLRYLLHGKQEHFDNTENRLFVCLQSGMDSYLGKLAHETLKQMHSEWRWVPENLYRQMNRNQLDMMKVAEVDVGTVEELLKDQNMQWLGSQVFSQNERFSILEAIRSETTWRRLPLHRTSEDQYVSLDIPIFYFQTQEDFPVPDSLKDKVVIIQATPLQTLNERYARFGRPWDPNACIEVCSLRNSPHEYFREILQTIHFMEAHNKGITESAMALLKTRPWLPTREGAACPRNVMDFPRLRGLLEEIFVSDGEHVLEDKILSEAKAMPGYAFVRRKAFTFNRNNAAALEIIGRQVMRLKKYHLGDFSVLEHQVLDLQSIATAFEGLPIDVAPAVSLLNFLFEEFGANAVSNRFISYVTGDMPLNKHLACLKYLGERAQNEKYGTNWKHISVFNGYFEMLCKRTDFKPHMLRGIFLLNQRGTWKSADFLSMDAVELNKGYMLNTDQAQLLALSPWYGQLSVLPAHNTTPVQEENPVKLGDYFKMWEGHVPPAAIGGFLALLGDGKPYISELAKHYLDPCSVEYFRSQIPWIIGRFGRENIHAVMKRLWMKFQFKDGESTLTVCSITGNQFEAKIRSDFNTLFIGDFAKAKKSNDSKYAVTLRVIDVSCYERPQLIHLLKKSSLYLLTKLFNQPANGFDKVWEKVATTDQLHLRIAQHHILENMFGYLKQFQNVLNSELKSLLKDRKELLRDEVQTGYLMDNEKRREFRFRLKQLIEEDTELQKELLGVVRRKIGQGYFNYDKSSIPFELFQNADDAAEELADMVPANRLPKNLDLITVICSEEHFSFMHWGRAINEFQRGQQTAEDPLEKARDLGYDEDLENMLIFHSSDKSERAEQVTGKFGLGFKSVFLLSDAPKVLSGEIGFRIIAGLFPQKLSDNDRSRLRRFISRGSSEAAERGTIFELPLQFGQPQLINDTILKFLELLPILLAFSRRIKRCVLKSKKMEKCLSWREKKVFGCQNVSFGFLDFLQKEALKATDAICLQGENRGTLLLACSHRGFARLPSHIPTFWVTAPTGNYLDAGIAINGMFSLDVGRDQLAVNSRETAECAKQLSLDIGKGLLELFSASEDWVGFSRELKLSGVNAYGFWNSLWELFASVPFKKYPENQNRKDAGTLLREIVWGVAGGYTQLITEQPAMPSGLYGPYRQLTCIPEIKWCIQGVLERKELFSAVSNWRGFIEHVLPGECISESKIEKTLLDRTLLRQNSARCVGLKEAIAWELGNQERVDPTEADLLGKTVTRTLLNRAHQDSHKRREIREIDRYLWQLSFLSASGAYQRAEDLLVATGYQDEEGLCAAFAPPSRLLSEKYSEDGMLFFKACRKEMKAPSSLLVEWAVAAEESRKRHAVLSYFLKGEKVPTLKVKISAQKFSTWLNDVRQCAEYAQFSGSEQLQIAGTLGYEMRELAGVSISKTQITGFRHPDQLLENIVRWWENNRDKELKRYEREVYPDGRFPEIESREPETEQDRVEWLKFILVSILQSRGWPNNNKNAKFIRFCADKGILTRLANTHTDRWGWLNSLEDHIDRQIQDIPFYDWMRRLVDVFIIARDLNDHVASLLSAGGTHAISMNKIFASKTNWELQGTDIAVPPIRKILGPMGSHFFLRELVRKNIIQNPGVHKYCFVPTTVIRRKIRELGGEAPDVNGSAKEEDSEIIFDYLRHKLGHNRAVFNRCFDIPFVIHAQKT